MEKKAVSVAKKAVTSKVKDSDLDEEIFQKIEGLIDSVSNSKVARVLGKNNAEVGDRVNQATDIVKTTCYKVSVLSLASYSAVLMPGVGEIVIAMFWEALGAGLVTKFQYSMVTRIAKLFEQDKDINAEMLDHVYEIASGGKQSQGETEISDDGNDVAFDGSEKLKAIAVSIAKARKTKFLHSVPYLGPITASVVVAVTAYLIGKRCISYFEQKRLLKEESGEFDPNHIQLETWDQSIESISTFDEDIISESVDVAIESSKEKLGISTESMGGLSVPGAERVQNLIDSGKVAALNKYTEGANAVGEGYNKAKAVVSENVSNISLEGVGDFFENGKAIIGEKISNGVSVLARDKEEDNKNVDEEEPT